MKYSSIVLLSASLLSATAFAGSNTEAAVGGALGGALGSVVGEHLGGSTGATIGAGVGGAAGGMVGADKRSRTEAAIGGGLGAAGGNVVGQRVGGSTGGLIGAAVGGVRAARSVTNMPMTMTTVATATGGMIVIGATIATAIRGRERAITNTSTNIITEPPTQ